MEKIAIIGVGNIGEALLQGLIASQVEPHHIIATCRSEERVAALAERYAIQATTDNVEAAADADVVFLCVKPNQIIDVIGEIAETVASNSVPTVLVSMAMRRRHRRHGRGNLVRGHSDHARDAQHPDARGQGRARRLHAAAMWKTSSGRPSKSC